MEYGQVCLRPGEALDLRGGRLLIYENEIQWVDDTCQNGDVVEVLDDREHFVAYGFFNALSKITVRILSFEKNDTIDAAFFRKRLHDAWAFRQRLGFSNACRVVFGESDFLPGLTIDKYGDYLSFQIVCLGMEQWKETLISLMVELFHPKGIFERDDLQIRQREGLPQCTGCVYGTIPERIQIREWDAKMYVNIAEGQKTGHFLDQQENRARLKPYVKGETVLDLCCCTGGFSIHAALYGAVSVEPVDVSAEALRLTMENAKLNGVAQLLHPTQRNVFDLVRDYEAQRRQYGVVICDPPAFAKSRRALDAAWRGYKELNLRSIRLVKPGGYFLTCSCSQFMTPELFLQMLTDASRDANRPIRLLETLIQSRDHPACLGAAQSLYLKGYLFQIL